MSYNILNKGVQFQGTTQGTIEDIVDTHSNQTVGGQKVFSNLSASSDFHVVGNMSASINVSASAFYGDGSNLSGVSSTGQTRNKWEGTTANGLLSYKSATTASVESNLTFNGTTNLLTVTGNLTASVNVSASAFYGDGANITGIPGSAVQLASNGGLENSSGLRVNPNLFAAASSTNGTDKIIVYDGAAPKYNTLSNILGLSKVTGYTNGSNDRVVTSTGADGINAEANLTFNTTNGLTVTGHISGSMTVSGSNGHFVEKLTAANIELGDATGIAGEGLTNNGGELNVQVSGAVKIMSDKLGLTGSIAGNGLNYGGGIDSINSLSVQLQSNSGLAVDGSGIKLDVNTLASATPDAAADSLIFIDANASSATKKMTFDNLAASLAGNGLDNSSGTLVLDLTEAGLGATANCIITDDGDGSVTPETSLKFDSNTLTFGATTNATASIANASGTDTAGKNFYIQSGAGTGTGLGGSIVFRTTEALGGSGTTVQDHFYAASITKKQFTLGGLQSEAYTKSSMVANKGNVDHGTVTGFARITIPNGDHAGAFRIFGTGYRADGDTSMAFELFGAISRVANAASYVEISTITKTSNAGNGSDAQRITNVEFSLSSASGGTGSTQTVDIQTRITVNDSSDSNSILYSIEILNAANDGITVSHIA